MLPGRILLDTYVPQAQQWCWRQHWYIHGESAWSLLGKFAVLNHVTAREIVDQIINRQCGKRTSIRQKPEVDLRDGSVFDLAYLAVMFRVPLARIRTAFLYETLPGTVLRSSEHLRWCQQCMAHAYHTPLFQMRLTRTCPIHRTALLQACPNCQRPVPYELNTLALANPFHCPFCAFDFCPTMGTPRPRIIRLSREDVANLSFLRKFHSAARAELVSASDADWLLSAAGRAEVGFIRHDEVEIECNYAGFMSQVLQDAMPGIESLQSNLQLEQISRHVCGSWRQVARDNDDELSEPSIPKRFCSGRQLNESESGLASLIDTYKALRRKLWRGVLKKHQRCIKSAAERIWWHVEGDCTVGFCPQALAFIRWRMLWEGCGTPRYLFARPAKDPFGIVGWHLAHPSPTPAHWSVASKTWIESHIFATASLESYGHLVRWAGNAWSTNKVVWERTRGVIDCGCLWAIAGHDCCDNPVKIYLRRPPGVKLCGASIQANEKHWIKHQSRIVQLRH